MSQIIRKIRHQFRSGLMLLIKFYKMVKQRISKVRGANRIGAVIILFFIAVLLIVNRSQHDNTKSKMEESVSKETVILTQTEGLHEELDGISGKLADVEKQLKQGGIDNVDAVEKTLSDLSEQTKALADKSNTIIEKAIEVNTEKLQRQLGDIQMQLSELKSGKKKMEYLSSDSLGFEVIDIYNMNHENIVSIHYGAHTVPVIVGENVAGWKLVRADFSDQKAEFVNNQDQHVIVNLNTPKV